MPTDDGRRDAGAARGRAAACAPAARPRAVRRGAALGRRRRRRRPRAAGSARGRRGRAAAARGGGRPGRPPSVGEAEGRLGGRRVEVADRVEARRPGRRARRARRGRARCGDPCARAARAAGGRRCGDGWRCGACSSGAPPPRLGRAPLPVVRCSGRAAGRLGGHPLGGAQPGAAGAGVGRDLGGASGRGPSGASRRSRGWRPQTQTGASGGQVQPRRSAWRKRLTIRSSSEW